MLENSEHVNLIGGEPTIHPDFDKIIKYLADAGASFSLTSNAVTASPRNLGKWRDLGLYNWSVSIDGLFEGAAVGRQAWEKADGGWGSLVLAEEMGYRERHATIVATGRNFLFLPELVQTLTAQGVWAEVTVLSWAKAPGYDVWPSEAEITPFKIPADTVWRETCEELALWAKTDPLAHNREPGYFDNELAFQGPHLTWFCSRPAMVFDADCRLRLCREIRGHYVPGLDPLTMSYQEWYEAWQRDVRAFCRGCLWDCHWQVCYWADREEEEAVRTFTHGLRSEGDGLGIVSGV